MNLTSENSEPHRRLNPKASWLFGILALAWAVLIHLLVGGPSPGGPGDFLWTFLINGGHAVLFAVQAFLLGLAFGNRWLGLAVLLAFVYGGMEEWVQAYLPDRSASYFDWATDGFGALFGVGVLYWGYSPSRDRLLWLLLWVFLASLSALGDTLWG